MDTKSPGLTNRIVQYDNEAKQMLAPTHQAKYGSPGLFPVVHFFKQDIPTISPKPKKVTVKIASPGWFFLIHCYFEVLNYNFRCLLVQQHRI